MIATMAVKLEPSVWAGRAVEFRHHAAGTSSPAAHAERVSLSDPAREASQGQGRPALGDVRWYRAVRKGPPRRRPAPVSVDPAWTASATATARAATERSAARNARSAIAAYLANMPPAAAPLS
jgi:hypothetical protein